MRSFIIMTAIIISMVALYVYATMDDIGTGLQADKGKTITLTVRELREGIKKK